MIRVGLIRVGLIRVGLIRVGLALLALSACTDPRLGLGIGLGPHGVTVRPSLSTTIGGVGVGASVPIQ